MKIFAISDTHFGHDRLHELGRPFGFSDRILKALSVRKGDLLIHCGDFCIGDDEKHMADFKEAAKDFKIKILVRGNHDGKSDAWYMEHGFDFVCKSFVNRYFGKKILFTHIPVRKHETDNIDFNVHGHMHGNGHRLTGELGEIYNPEWHRDLAPELNDYAPVNLENFLK